MMSNGNVLKLEPQSSSKSMIHAKDLVGRYTLDLEQRGDGIKRYLDSGFEALDDQLGPWLHEGHLLIIAGRPAMGKSVLGQQLAEHVAIDYSSIIFSLEMSADELIERSISRRSNIPVNVLKGYSKPGDLTKNQWDRFTEATGDISQINLLIDDSTYSLDQILIKMRAAQRALVAGGYPRLRLVVVDYLQLVETSSQGQSNRTLAVGEVSRALKRAAKELGIPVVALCQLSRSLEGRPDKRPLLSDLRESGNIEQDSDFVLMVYRDEVYDEESTEPGIAELINRKNRHGPSNTTIKLPFSGCDMAFGNRGSDDKSREVTPRSAPAMVANMDSDGDDW